MILSYRSGSYRLNRRHLVAADSRTFLGPSQTKIDAGVRSAGYSNGLGALLHRDSTQNLKVEEDSGDEKGRDRKQPSIAKYHERLHPSFHQLITVEPAPRRAKVSVATVCYPARRSCSYGSRLPTMERPQRASRRT